jgi:hypothetical protein
MDVEGSGIGLILGINTHLPSGTEENREKYQSG